MSLTPEQVVFFQEHGYLILEKLFEEEELEALRRRAEWIASGDATHVPEQYRQVEPRVAQGELAAEEYVLSLRKLSHMAWYDEVMLAHARDLRITDRIAAMLGPDLKLYQDQLFMKPPRVGSRMQRILGHAAGKTDEAVAALIDRLCFAPFRGHPSLVARQALRSCDQLYMVQLAPAAKQAGGCHGS